MCDDNKGYTITPFPRLGQFYIDTFAIGDAGKVRRLGITLPFHTLFVTLSVSTAAKAQFSLEEILSCTCERFFAVRRNFSAFAVSSVVKWRLRDRKDAVHGRKMLPSRQPISFLIAASPRNRV